MDTDKFAAFIAERRRELGMTQDELAKKLNVTDKAVSRWENGHGFPDVNTLEPLADALGISIVELMKSEMISEDAISPKTADEALSDTIEMAGIETKRSRIRTILTIFAAVFGVVIILFLGWQIWGYNNPDITIGFGQPVGYAPNVQEILESYDGSDGEWVSVGPWKHHYRSIPIAGISERSIFGKSKTWTIRLLQWHIASEYYVNESYRLAKEEPYIFLGRIDIVDGKTWFTRIGYYTENGVTKPLYDVWTFDFIFENYENLSDETYDMVWSEFPEVKEACDRKMTTAEWNNLQDERS